LKTIKQIIFILLLLNSGVLQAQSPAFYHLSTAEGLSENNVNIARRDKNGVLWVGTTEGLNSFDGNRIHVYYKQQYPALADNDIQFILIDSLNRIWLRTASPQLTLLDEQRRFHSFTIGDTANKKNISHIIHTEKYGLVVFKGTGQYAWKNKSKKHFEPIGFPGDTIIPGSIRNIVQLNNDRFVFYGENRLVMVGYSENRVLLNMPVPEFGGVASINQSELIAYPVSGNAFYRINLVQKKIVEEYHGLKNQFGETVKADMRGIARIDEHRFAISSRFSGLFLLNLENKTLHNWQHDPLDQRSIGGNNTYRVHYDSTGYLFATTQTSGVHYINLLQPVADYRPYFKNETAEVFDGYIQSITTDKEGNLWLGAQDRLIKWNRKTNQNHFIPYRLPNGTALTKKETVRAVCFDANGNLWVGTSNHGILILNKQQHTIAQLTDSMPEGKTSLPSNWLNAFCADNRGTIWAGGLEGICKIEEKSLRIADLSQHPLLNKISRIPCYTIWLDGKKRLWMGTTRGAWRYDEEKQELIQFTTENGLAANHVLAFNEDNNGNTYIGTPAGLSILSPFGQIANHTRGNGLRNDKCEGLLRDEQGFIWVGNLNCILRYDPQRKKFAVFEEGQGFSHAGFRMRSCFKSASGEMFWGSDKGLTYFYPAQMNNTSALLHPSVNELQISDSVYRFTRNETLHLPYYSSSFIFRFSSGELTGGKKSQYLYRLHGYDDDWHSPEINGQVMYGQLPPGTYRFECKASRDGENWYSVINSITLIIAKPWWRQTWFRLLCIFFAFSVLYWAYRYFKRRRENRQVNRMINYFASSGYENASVENILWDISRNCIAQLGFEDYVIYLKDEESDKLVQKAAYGPKNEANSAIVNPIEIPVGKGIVGNVAATGLPLLIKNTKKDSRYIVDDQERLSELAVPIIHDEKVIGVMDSEHHKKNYFTNRHLKILQTIAAICAAKISRAIALDAMKKSKMELMELNVKMAESKFLNLRLQMNPHFLFNSLSSIQHLIVSQQTTKAYKYLTVFSNFLRSLLKHAENNFIPLDEELNILKMYIELESLRFDQSFSYELHADEGLCNEEILVPSLMVQPFAENAIWHGLLHKEGEKKLLIRFSNHNDEYLVCVVEDNGVGRRKSDEIQKGKISSMVHESRGINIIQERLALLQQKTGKPASVEMIDLYDAQQQPVGTRVKITIPYYNPEEK
jgi:ligand-binding sensor domain-containing protein/putative methionine-R-sulfoxide reductase with GAF domain